MSPAVSNREGSKGLTIQEGIANQSTWVLHLQDSMLDLMSWHAPGAGLDCGVETRLSFSAVEPPVRCHPAGSSCHARCPGMLLSSCGAIVHVQTQLEVRARP